MMAIPVSRKKGSTPYSSPPTPMLFHTVMHTHPKSTMKERHDVYANDRDYKIEGKTAHHIGVS